VVLGLREDSGPLHSAPGVKIRKAPFQPASNFRHTTSFLSRPSSSLPGVFRITKSATYCLRALTVRKVPEPVTVLPMLQKLS
jgi:hypothetical protein